MDESNLVQPNDSHPIDEINILFENIVHNNIDALNQVIITLTQQITRSDLDQNRFLSWMPKHIAYPNPANFSLQSFKKIRFRKLENIPSALLAFLDTVAVTEQPFFYAMARCNGECYLFAGIWPGTELPMREAFRVVQDSLTGFFPGCETESLLEKEIGFSSLDNQINEFEGEEEICAIDSKEVFLSNLQKMNKRVAILGIPAQKFSSNKETQSLPVTGIEDVADSVPEDYFLIVHASPISLERRLEAQRNISNLHNLVHIHVKKTLQSNESGSKGGSSSATEGISEQETIGENQSESQSRTRQNGFIRRFGQNLKTFSAGGAQNQYQETQASTLQQSHTRGVTSSWTESSTWNVVQGSSESEEKTNKHAAWLEELLNRHHKRVSSGAQLWEVFTEVCSNDMNVSKKIASLLCGILSGDENTLEPMRNLNVSPQIGPHNFHAVSVSPDHPFGALYSGLSSILTTTELGRITRLPLHDLPGIEVEKLADYGRNWPHVKEIKNSLNLGCLIDHEIDSKRYITIESRQFLRHCFISGATGSGKSTTMRSLLTQLWGNNTPFLVIEPVKREYRYLVDRIQGLKAFALGHKDCRFSINPFNFSPEVGLIPHIDLLKSAFQASLGMYSSMPFILEHIIYEAYKQNGWNIATSSNASLERVSRLFGFNSLTVLWTRFLPRLRDLVGMVDEAIDDFFPQNSDYSISLVGALKSRLNSLCQGAKGNLLDSSVETSFDKLLESPVVLELWPFADNEEKAFVMALLLMRIYEYRQAQEIGKGGGQAKNLVHLLVIEEAHRLLAKVAGSGEHSQQGRQKGVDVFADILAEIRSYGQGIVVVDQIPSKLVPDVLRNTDLKIAHRLVDKEDRTLLGATMNLDEEQTRDIARFTPGQACLYYSGLRKPLHVKIKESILVMTDGEKGEIEDQEFPDREDSTKASRQGFDLWLAKVLCLFLLAPKSRFNEYIDNALNELANISAMGGVEEDSALNQIGYAAIEFFDYLEENGVPRRISLETLCAFSELITSVFSLNDEFRNRLIDDCESISLFSQSYTDFQNLVAAYHGLNVLILYYWLSKITDNEDLLPKAFEWDCFGFNIPQDEVANILNYA